MDELYKQHLDTIHSRLQTSNLIISDTIREATGQSIENKQRIIAGEANEVYDITLDSGTHVIVRIAGDKKDFEQERFAIDACRALGVPVPQILLIKHLVIDEKPVDICIQKKLEGDLLERGSIDVSSIPRNDLQRIVHEAGAMLSKIHSIKTTGWGYINRDGMGLEPSFKVYWDKFMEREKSFIEIAEKINFDTKLMQKIFTYLQEEGAKIPEMPTTLTHNDFHPKHLMITNGHISGILDFGEVSAHLPENDFVKWRYWNEETYPLEWLLEGYGKEKLGEYFEDLMQLFGFELGLSSLEYYYQTGFKNGVDYAKKKLFELTSNMIV